MKIALIGYGKMGKMIEEIALERGNEITCRIDKDNTADFESDDFRNSDVAIEFTTPATARKNIGMCFKAGVPVVCGTTGWVNQKTDSGITLLEDTRRLCEAGEGTLLWASSTDIWHA